MLCALLGCLLVGGCSVISQFNAGRYDRHNALGDAWLSDQVLEPSINITGRYVSPDWGESFFSQYGRDVRGHLGDYPVKGVVSGNKVYLLVSESGWYYYSAILEMPQPGVLNGYYSRSVPYKKDLRHSLQLLARY